MLLAATAAAKSPSIWAEPGTLGFLVVFGLCIIMYFVFRSMSKHLRKVREAAVLEHGQSDPGQDPDGGSPPGGGLRPDSGNQRPGGSAPAAPLDDDHERQQSEQNALLMDR